MLRTHLRDEAQDPVSAAIDGQPLSLVQDLPCPIRISLVKCQLGQRHHARSSTGSKADLAAQPDRGLQLLLSLPQAPGIDVEEPKVADYARQCQVVARQVRQL
jgi:hypothetical protein